MREPMCEQRSHVALAVDDGNLFSESIRQALVRRGFEVLCAKSPHKGLAVFQAHRSKIDLVAIDMATPAASNLDLAAELERLRPGLPILYLVGEAKSIVRCCIEAQAPGSVLVTPFTEDRLLERVGGLLAIDVAVCRAPDEHLWERLMAASDEIPSGSAILHVYELRQAALAADHVAMLRAGGICHSIRSTNCDAAPYGVLVRARDIAHARTLLAQPAVARQLVSAA